MHQQNHLDNLGTYVPECLAQTKPHSPKHTPFTTFNERPTDSQLLTCPCFTFSCVHNPTSFIHSLHILHMSQIFSSFLINYQLLMKAADSTCFMEGEINNKLM